MPTVQEIVEPVLRDLGMDSSSSLINDAKQRLIDYVNDSIQEFNILANWNILKTQGTLTLDTGVDIYALASDADVNRVLSEEFYIPSKDKTLEREDDAYFGEKLNIGDTGLPQVWRTYGRNASGVHQVQFYPKPATAENNLSVAYYYIKKVTTLTSYTDVTTHQEVLLRDAIKAKYLEYDDDFSRADRYTQRTNTLARKLIARNQGAKQFKPRFS